MKKRQPRTGWLHFQTRSSRRHGTGAEGTRSASILGSLASVAHGHQLCGELPVHRHYLDRPPSPYAVRRASDARIDMDQLRPSFHGVAPALCDRMDCAHPACLIPCSVLRRTVRVHRRCLQRLRAPSIGPCGRHAGVRAYAAYGEAPIARCPCELHDRYAGRDRRASASVSYAPP